MSAPTNNHVYDVNHIDEVVDYRTLRVGIDLGFNCGTTIDLQIDGIKTIGGTTAAADEKREAARLTLEETTRHGAIVVDVEKSGDDFMAKVWVDGKQLNVG
jgi:hypothetical protein